MSIQEHRNNYSLTEQVKNFIYEHPTVIKVAEIGGLLLGIGSLIALPFRAPDQRISLALSGSLLTIASTAALLFLDLFAPPCHRMQTHCFIEGVYQRNHLFYQGDVPILSLDYSDPYKAGYAQGVLCGEAISTLMSRLKLPQGKDLPKTLQRISEHIPQYLSELQGLTDGYGFWQQKMGHFNSPTLTIQDFLLLQLLPDWNNFYPQESLFVACSLIGILQEGRGPLILRNMDWPSLGCAGAFSLLVNRRLPEGVRTVEIGLPGIIGTITGMNQSGLCIAMNVCDGEETNAIRGMCALLYNRSLLQGCKTEEEAGQFIAVHPLTPYHLSIADPTTLVSHTLPKRDSTTRKAQGKEPFVVLNHCYDPSHTEDRFYNRERAREISRFFSEPAVASPEEVLTLPYVNNALTLHRIVMEPASRSIRVAFDNAYAGRSPLHRVDTTALFAP